MQYGNQIRDEGALAFGEGLKFNTSVQRLYLVSCRGVKNKIAAYAACFDDFDFFFSLFSSCLF